MRRALSIFLGLLASAAFGGFVFSSSAHAKRQRTPAIAETVRPVSLESLPPAEGWFSLLDEQGRLEKPIAASTLALWQREAHLPGNSTRLAQVHVWLGECAMDSTEDVEAAQWHWNQAQKLVGSNSPLAQLARLDSAILEYFRGADGEAVDRFKTLLATARPKGYSHLAAAVWYRHASIAAGFHEANDRLGIPEPPAPDPLCAASGFAKALGALGLRHDRAYVLSLLHHTGFGSSSKDISDASEKLGLVSIELSANEKGLRALPKPLIAHVEHDHFVAVTAADGHGVSYLCSDCGPWPGGTVHLSWKQWRALQADMLLSIQRKGGLMETAIRTAATIKPSESLATCAPQLYQSQMSHLVAALRNNITLNYLPYVTNLGTCGSAHMPNGTYSAPGQQGAADCPGSGEAGAGTCGDPVNLATGQEEYSPAPDLQVYNPIGPSVTFSRTYGNMRGESPGTGILSAQNYGYNSTDFGSPWAQSYDMDVYDASAPAEVEIVQTQSKFVNTDSNDTPAGGAVWDVTLNGTVVASSLLGQQNGWTVTGTSSSGGTVTAPSTVSVSAGYELRWTYYASPYSSHFGVLAPGTISAGGTGYANVTGSNALGSGT